MQDDFVTDGGLLLDYLGDGGAVRIPAGTEELATGAFRYRGYVTSVDIPGSVKEIGFGAFRGCSDLRRVQIAEGTELICPGAFADCARLEAVQLPGTLQWIAPYAFDGCPAGLRITVSGGGRLAAGSYPQEALRAMIAAAGIRPVPGYRAMTAWENFGSLGRAERERLLAGEFRLCFKDELFTRRVCLFMDGMEFECTQDLIDRERDLWLPLPPAELFGHAAYTWEHDQYGRSLAIWRKRDILYLALDEGRATAFLRYDDYCRALPKNKENP